MTSIEFEMVVDPVYNSYKELKDASLYQLHTEFYTQRAAHTQFKNANLNDLVEEDFGDMVRAWHRLQAIIFILRDKFEWNEETREPNPFIINDEKKVTPYKELVCITCNCQCSWDKQSWETWNGDCPCCGTLLDPNRKEKAA